MWSEEEIIAKALFHQENGKEQDQSESGKCASWYGNVHDHYQRIVRPYIQNQNEHFVEYFPIKFLFGESSSYHKASYESQMYHHTYGTFGTGYICFSDKCMYITALNDLTIQYPLYPTGSKRFLLAVVEGMAGKRDKRKPYQGDKTWRIEYAAVSGADIVKDKEGVSDVVFIKTAAVDWQIHEHFTDTLTEILGTIKMGHAEKLVSIWQESQNDHSQIFDLLERLN